MQTLTIVRDDYTFSINLLQDNKSYGMAGDCGSHCSYTGTSSMDLTGTGFYFTSALTEVRIKPNYVSVVVS